MALYSILIDSQSLNAGVGAFNKEQPLVRASLDLVLMSKLRNSTHYTSQYNNGLVCSDMKVMIELNTVNVLFLVGVQQYYLCIQGHSQSLFT